MKKPTLLERLTGAINSSDIDDAFEEDRADDFGSEDSFYDNDSEWSDAPTVEEEPEEGELPIDMYQTGDNIVIRALVAGVDPDNLEISITRDMVTLRGHREEYQEANHGDYYYRELFWGGFSRSILLPEEIVIDEAEAREKHGLLEIVLPKVDKERSTNLKVTSK